MHAQPTSTTPRWRLSHILSCVLTRGLWDIRPSCEYQHFEDFIHTGALTCIAIVAMLHKILLPGGHGWDTSSSVGPLSCGSALSTQGKDEQDLMLVIDSSTLLRTRRGSSLRAEPQWACLRPRLSEFFRPGGISCFETPTQEHNSVSFIQLDK